MSQHHPLQQRHEGRDAVTRVLFTDGKAIVSGNGGKTAIAPRLQKLESLHLVDSDDNITRQSRGRVWESTYPPPSSLLITFYTLYNTV